MDISEDEKWHKQLKNTAKELNQVSPTFCAAKWLQVTLHLQNGMTHSCHHPMPHRIPMDELKTDSGALHNTKFKQEQRALMLEGKRPKECDHCWRAEDNSKDTWSDRFIKSADDWAQTDFNKLSKEKNPNPTYLEVSFSNACNLKCMYCAPEISSAIWGELEKFGPYPVGGSYPIEWYDQNQRRPYKLNEKNPFVDAFEDWFPRILPTLKVFRITGGEPLLSPQTFKTIESLQKGNFPELDFSINSNLMIQEKLLERLAQGLEDLAINKKLKNVRLYTSVDAHGAQANWIRHGMDYKVLFKHAHRFLKMAPNVDLTFIATHNLFSLSSFNLLLADILEMKRAHIKKINRSPKVMVDITYLRRPTYLSSLIAPKDLRSNARYSWEFMERNAESMNVPWGFNSFERNKMLRLCEVLEKGPQEKEAEQLEANRRELKRFVLEYEKRKGSKYAIIFPEYYDFIEGIKAD